VRFGDFLRATVLTSTAGASALIIATLASVNRHDDTGVLWVSLAWWAVAVIIGTWLGRESAVSESIRSLLADARSQSTLPELNPARTFLNRLWPLMFATVAAAAAAVVLAQAPAVVAGFLIIGGFAWRRQGSAVTAIEDRDGARFYVDRTAFYEPIRLIRTPGFRANVMELNGAGPPAAGGV
jgi:hypothetical protein